MIGEIIDRVIGVFSPSWALDRIEKRATMSQLQALTSPKGGYFPALGSKAKYPRSLGSHSENAIDQSQFPELSNAAWEKYRTDPHFRKIVRSLCSKVIGPGMMPNSQARKPDGDPYEEFRSRAKQLWEDCQGAIDYRGKPGQGGETLAGLQHLAFKTIMLSGEELYLLHPINGAEQQARSLPVPITIQLIDPQRLADDLSGTRIEDGHIFYRGIELDSDRRRYRYWLKEYQANSSNINELDTIAEPYSAGRMYHVFLKEDEEQLRGTTWFAAALMPSRHGSDLRYNFVKSSAMQACVVLSYTLATGKSKLGRQARPNEDLTDDDGNTINYFSPGMCINKGKDGKVDMHSPNINIGGYEGLIASIARDEAAAVPGTKSSTITGDYRNSSFSSERSADNDNWPEIEVLQGWFSAHWCQPIYEAIVIAGVQDGYFDEVEGFSTELFNSNRAAFLRCTWQGPVARSINPVDDVQAAALRIKSGISTPQIEAQKLGLRVEDIIHQIREFQTMCEDAELPEVYVNNVLGLDTTDVVVTNETEAANANGGANVAEKQAA
jgi:lambda family phage portal protein